MHAIGIARSITGITGAGSCGGTVHIAFEISNAIKNPY
jgi:hypothetical protein